LPSYVTLTEPHCNICGKELNEKDRQSTATIHKQLRYGYSDDDGKHHIHWCADCFKNLLKNCKHETQVANFTEVRDSDYDEKDTYNKAPGKFCTVCEEGLVVCEVLNRNVIQIETHNIKTEIRFCNMCMDGIIKSCKLDPLYYMQPDNKTGADSPTGLLRPL